MEKSTQALRERAALTELIRNIRSVRHQIRDAKTFDTELFNKINGTDHALESLVGRDVIVEALTEAETNALRRDIMQKLNASEADAFASLRGTLECYFANLTKAVEEFSVTVKDQEAVVAKAKSIKPELAAKALTGGNTDTGLYSAKNVEGVVFAFEKAVTFLNAVTPVMARILADQDDTEELVPPTPDEGSTAAEPEKIEETQTNNVLPEEHTVIVDPAKEDENALSEIKAAAEANRSMALCLDKFNGGGTPAVLGYSSVESILTTLKTIDACCESYGEMLKNFSNLLPVTTCVSDDLGHGSVKFFDTLDSLMNLVAKCEDVRANMMQTKITLVDILGCMENV